MRVVEIRTNKNVEFVSVDDFFEFSVKYHDLYSSANTVLQSKETIVDWATTGIWLINDDKFLVRKDGNWINVSESISSFLDWQNPDSVQFPISLKMLFNAIVDSLKGIGYGSRHSINHSIGISEIAMHYNEEVTQQEEQEYIQEELHKIFLEKLEEKIHGYCKKKKHE